MTTAASPGQITGSTDTTSSGGFFGDSTVNGISNLVADDVVAAQTAATNAAASATSAATSYDNFDDRYLGQKSTDPTVDNDGDALLTGALYFDTTNNVMKVYNGSAWQRTTPTSSDQTNINALSQSAVITDMALLANADVITDMSILGTADVVADLNTLGTADVVNDMNVLGTASNVTNMDTLAGISGDITTVAGINSNVTTVAGISSDVTAVANDATDIGVVSTNISNVNTVAGIDSNVTTVAGIASDVTAVANDATDIGIVSTNISSVNTVATNIADVITVAGDLTEAISEIETAANDLNEATSEIDTVANSIANVDTVGTNISNVNTVAGISGNVTAVAGVTSDVTTVAGISGDVSTVAGISSNVTTVSGISSNVTSVAGVASDVSTVAPIVANVTTVAGISPNVTTVAGISSDVTTVSSNTANVTTVAGISSDVTTVAGISSNVTSVANNESNINSAVSNASNINTVSGSISNVNTVATNISSVNNFSEVYRISSTAPTTSLNIGDLYFNTTSNSMQVYGASGWQNAGSSVNGTSERFHYDITSTVGSVSGADANGNTLAYDSGYVDVYVNGVRMSTADITITSGDTVTFAENLVNGDEVDIVAYGTFSITNLDASNLDSGTIPDARFPATLPAISGANLTNLDASDLASGTVPDARITGAYTGITTVGQLTFADNEKALFGADSDLQIHHDGFNSYIKDAGSGGLIVQASTNVAIQGTNTSNLATFFEGGAVTLYHNNAATLNTTSTGINVTGVITTDGMTTSADINFGDNDKAVFGAGSDLQIYHDGFSSYILDNGTGQLDIKTNGTEIRLTKTPYEPLLTAKTDGPVELYYDGGTYPDPKLVTTATGIQVTGNIANVSGDFRLDTTSSIILDAGGDGQIELADTGTTFGILYDTSNNFGIYSAVQDKDIIFQGNDGGSTINALTLDMSEAGRATFNNVIRIPTNLEHDGDADTFFGFPANNNFVITAGNVNRVYGSATETVINEDSANLDFRVESDTNTHMLFVDASANVIGIGTNTPDTAYSLDVNGKVEFKASNNGATTTANNQLVFLDTNTSINADDLMGQIAFNTSDTTNTGTAAKIQTRATNAFGSGELQIWSGTPGTLNKNVHFRGDQAVFNEDGNDMDFRVESDVNTHMLFVDAGNNSVKINSSSTTYDGDAPFQIGYSSTNVYHPHIQTDNRTYIHFTGAGGGSANNSYIHGYQIDNPASGSYLRVAQGLSSTVVSGVQQNQNGLTYVYNAGKSTGDADYTPTISHRIDFFTGGSVVFNEVGGDIDFRVESDANTHALFVDAGTSRIGIGTGSPVASGETTVTIGSRTIVGKTVNGQSLFSDNVYFTGSYWTTKETDQWAAIRTNDGSLRFHTGQTSHTAGTSLTSMDSTSMRLYISDTTVVVNEVSQDTDFRVESDGNSNMLFVDAGNNRVGIGTSSPQEQIHSATSGSNALRVSGSANDNAKVEIGFDTTNGAYLKAGSSVVTKLQFYVDNISLAGEFRSNGDFYTNDGTVHSLSDSRIKKDIADLTDGLDIVKQLRPRTFKYNGKATTLDDNRTRYGFVADEVMAIASQYVSQETQTIDGVEVDDFKSISTTKMIPMLVKAIQELEARITTLENGE